MPFTGKKVGVGVSLETTRGDKIIRTESIRYGSYAEEEVRKQSGVVKYKQRWTAPDERACDNCKALHKKKVKLDEEFEDEISGSPLHPNCRCDLIPCID